VLFNAGSATCALVVANAISDTSPFGEGYGVWELCELTAPLSSVPSTHCTMILVNPANVPQFLRTSDLYDSVSNDIGDEFEIPIEYWVRP
jgi:hypothetical protein